MRLLLDEHYSKLIAERLLERGHDVVSTTERTDLAGLNDPELFALMAMEHRAIVTENWADFQREIRKAEAEGLDHYGVLFTSNRQMPRLSPATPRRRSAAEHLPLAARQAAGVNAKT